MSLLIKNAPAFLLRDARHAMHDILLLRISAILPEAISDGGVSPPTDTDLLLATYRGGSHFTSDIHTLIFFCRKKAVFVKHIQNIRSEKYLCKPLLLFTKMWIMWITWCITAHLVDF